MKNKFLSLCASVLLLFFILGWSARPSWAGMPDAIDDFSYYLPLVANNQPVPPQQWIVVDHRHTDIHQIPPAWIEQARKYLVHYAHTSHGSQVLTGLEWLKSRDAIAYNVDIHVGGLVEMPDDDKGLRIYDGNNYAGTHYITPDMYWESTDGMNHTRQVANTGWFHFSLWTWCGQMSDPGTAVQTYLDVLAQFENQYPSMRFIYYTGHTDGNPPGSALLTNNETVRQYVQNNQKVLFDFADIESYDPAGTFYSMASDSCGWCNTWCSAHPLNFECLDLPASDSECAHTHGLQCTLKGQAFWWLMARLAGWNGTP